ncbi:hypothetical protein N9D37_00040 [Erythrobacter sp.]|nr:hypothetical protein [Erythrobacter sp.]
MKNFIASAITIGSLAALGVTAPALADEDGNTKAQKPEIVEKDARGKATKVRISDKVYDVCMTSTQDDCINPRAAGLNFGNRALDYWPGKPASELD